MTLNAGTAKFSGDLVFAKNTPLPADLANGECVQWFDATPGASKVRFMGRDFNGNIVAGAVALA